MANTPNQRSGLSSAPVPTSPAAHLATVACPLKALHKIVQRRVSGQLNVQGADAESIAWRVHMGGGQLHFATSSVGQRERLAYILQRAEPRLAVQLPANVPSDYEFLHQAWRERVLSLAQLRRLVYFLTQETLVHVLALPQAMLQFDRTFGLDPILLSLPLRETLLPLSAQAIGWRRLKTEISSPFQRPQLVAPAKFMERYADKLQALYGPKARQTLLQALDEQPCIYDLALRLDADLLKVASALAALVRLEVLALRPFAQMHQPRRPTIACIDDSSTVQRKVQLILKALGYQVLSLTNPLQALSSLVREKPVLVLLDISMPDLDGYELCRMLRQCSALREIPIVMLTGRDGLIDRVRARLVGASDYITKPFDTKTLTDVIAKQVQEAV